MILSQQRSKKLEELKAMEAPSTAPAAQAPQGQLLSNLKAPAEPVKLGEQHVFGGHLWQLILWNILSYGYNGEFSVMMRRLQLLKTV